jgi:hypothetical protein
MTVDRPRIIGYGIGMDATPHGWRIFNANAPILTYVYSFGPGTANSLAVGGKDGLVIVSAPCKVAEGVFEDLARFGKVRALVASNAFHHMGIPEWKRRFPDAEIFAPAQSIARVEKQTGLRGIRSLAEAAAITGPALELVDMPHYKTGEVLVRVKTDRGLVWYVTDVVMNLPSLPAHPVGKAMFALTRSAPGLKFNNLAPLFMVRDKKALKRWLAAQLDMAPPTWLIPTHGDIVEAGPRMQEMRRLFVTR